MKDTIQNYGWIVITLIVLSIMIALASPFATAVADNIMMQANDLGDQMDNAPDYVPPYAVKLSANNTKSGTIEFIGDYSGTKIFLKTTATVTVKATPAEGCEFLGWYVNGVLVSEDLEYTVDVSKETTFTAKFSNSSSGGGAQLPAGGEVSAQGEILDSWEVIINNVNNGTYSTKYAVGNYKPLDLGSEGTINMQIAAFDTDVMSDNSSNAHITWIAKELLSTKHVMNSTRTSENGWEASEMRAYLQTDIWALIDPTVQNAIVAVDKSYNDRQANETKICSDKLWIPSDSEIFGLNDGEYGIMYTELFTYDSNWPYYTGDYSRLKTITGETYYWWLRTASTDTGFYVVGFGDYILYASGDCFADYNFGVALSFCF